jgi:hypothetical protein
MASSFIDPAKDGHLIARGNALDEFLKNLIDDCTKNLESSRDAINELVKILSSNLGIKLTIKYKSDD